MLVNWWLEIRKWQILVAPYEKVNFLSAFKAVIGSLAFGIATPNRVGEYGFRALYLSPQYRKTGVLLTILSSLSQLIFTLIGGVLAGIYWLSEHPEIRDLPSFAIWLFLGISLLVITSIFLFISYFKLSYYQELSRRFGLLKKVIPAVSELKLITNSLRLRLLILSLLRYFVFLMQYIIVWRYFGADLHWYESLLSSAIIFLLMAFVPTIALAELGVRGQVSVWIAGIFTENFLAIVAGSAFIWFVNLFLPALCGSVLLWSFRVKNK